MQKAGETVKKTILAAVGMIAVFSFAVFVFSGMMEKQWQTPQQDEIELTASSPVEMVEKEYKEYKYNTDVKSNWFYGKTELKDGMLTYSEAASIAGKYIEEMYWYVDISDVIFDIAVLDDNRFLVQHLGTEEKGEKSFYLIINCYIDAYTGEIISIGNTIKSTNYTDKLITELISEIENNPETFITDKIKQAVEMMGYNNISYLNIMQNLYGYEISVEAESELKKDLLCFEINNYYVKEELINWNSIEYNCRVYPDVM